MARDFWKIVEMLRGHRRMIVQSIGVNLFMILVSLIPPYLTKVLIDNVYPNQDEHLLYIVLILTVLISIFSGLYIFYKWIFCSQFEYASGSKNRAGILQTYWHPQL